MRHRLASGTGLGNPNPENFTNNGDLSNTAFWDEFLKDATNSFSLIKDFGGFDFEIFIDGFSFGIEPAYQWDQYLEVFIAKDKEQSRFTVGTAFGPYGSQLVKSTKMYSDYKRSSKFTKFIDKWHDEVLSELGVGER